MIKRFLESTIINKQWISVKDDLPHTNDLVLTYAEEIDGHKYRLIVPNLSLRTFPNAVTHWMPLPKPPKGT